jgi:multidrug efflux pump subunit AcrB
MAKKEYKNIAGYLAKVFLTNPITMILGIAILALGYISLVMMPREEDPQIQVSGGSVIVAMPGASPQEISNVIIKPLERRLSEIKGIEHIYGMAMDSVGMLNVQYHIGENREDSNLKLYDKVMQNMDLLPKGTMPPLIKPFDIDIDIPILTVAFYKKPGSPIDNVMLYNTIREIQQDINSIENVSKSTLKGVRKPQFNVLVDLDRLSGYHISLGQVAQAIKSIASNAPDIDAPTNSASLVVFGIKNAIEDMSDLQSLIVAQYQGAPIYLRDIAEITYGCDVHNYQTAMVAYQDKDDNISEDYYQEYQHNYVFFNSIDPQITLTISKLKGTNAVTIAEKTLAYLEKTAETLEEKGVGYIITRNYGTRANEAVNELVHHLIITIFIICLILIPFLGWKESLVVTIAVPMILATTLFLAMLTDQTINRITLFAFLLSLGLIVDDAIIVIENIHRRLHLEESKGQDFEELIVEATDEIGPSTNIATIAIMLTMIPMAFVGGMMGQFMLPIPLNVPVALGVSLFVAYVFTPYLAKKFIDPEKIHHADEGKDSAYYKSLLRTTIDYVVLQGKTVYRKVIK